MRGTNSYDHTATVMHGVSTGYHRRRLARGASWLSRPIVYTVSPQKLYFFFHRFKPKQSDFNESTLNRLSPPLATLSMPVFSAKNFRRQKSAEGERVEDRARQQHMELDGKQLRHREPPLRSHGGISGKAQRGTPVGDCCFLPPPFGSELC